MALSQFVGHKLGDKGFFKMAMYPFNKIAQFDKQVMTDIGGPIGSLILIRATKSPTAAEFSQISQIYLNNIKRMRADSDYRANPEEVASINRANLIDIDIDIDRNKNKKRIEDLEDLDNDHRRELADVKQQNKIWWYGVIAAIIFLFASMYLMKK